MGVSDKEGNIASLSIGSRNIVRRGPYDSHARASNDHISMTGDVLAEICILPRPGRETRRVDHDGESSGRCGRLTDCLHLICSGRLPAVEPILITGTEGPRFRPPETRFRVGQINVITERHTPG